MRSMVLGPDGREHLMLIAITENAKEQISYIKTIIEPDGTPETAQVAFSRVLASLDIIDRAHALLIQYMESLGDKITNKQDSLSGQIKQQKDAVAILGGKSAWEKGVDSKISEATEAARSAYEKSSDELKGKFGDLFADDKEEVAQDESSPSEEVGSQGQEEVNSNLVRVEKLLEQLEGSKKIGKQRL